MPTILSINFNVPEDWHDLGDKQLRYVYQLFAQEFTSDEVKTLCLLQWSDTKVIGKQPSGAYLLRKGKTFFEVTSLTIAELLPALAWLDTVPKQPVRISKINRKDALPADFSEVPFETFIICDNFYQGYLQTQDDNLLYPASSWRDLQDRLSRERKDECRETASLNSRPAARRCNQQD